LQFIIKDGKENSIRIFPPFAVSYQDGIPCSAVMLEPLRSPLKKDVFLGVYDDEDEE